MVIDNLYHLVIICLQRCGYTSIGVSLPLKVKQEHDCMNNKIGKIDISQLNIPPEKHEFETAKYFAAMGKDITFIRPSSIPNQHRPDIFMDGLEWEMKAPTGSGKRNIEYNFRKAITQSKNIIFDLRHVKISEQLCIAQLEKEFLQRPYLNKLYIIKKNGELLIYPQK